MTQNILRCVMLAHVPSVLSTCHWDNFHKKTVCPPVGHDQAPQTTSSSDHQHKVHHKTTHEHSADHATHHKPISRPKNSSKVDGSLVIPTGTDFFKGDHTGQKQANWDYLSGQGEKYASNWHSSWSPDGSSFGYPPLCKPFEDWIKSDYLESSKKRVPVRCHLAVHQGLGDQLKGIMRCWAAALITQRPLIFDHTHSRSSWLWTDDSSILPGELIQSRVHFNASKVPHNFEEIEIDHLFRALMPCVPHIGMSLGGVTPFLGLKPVLENLKRHAHQEPGGACDAILEKAYRLITALEKSKGDDAYCMIRTLVRPSDAQIKSMNVILGQAVTSASEQCNNSPHHQMNNCSINKHISNEKKHFKSGSVAVVGLHLRLQEDISTALDMNWGLQCASLVGAQFAQSGNGGKGSSIVIFVLATDTPTLLGSIADKIRSSEVCQKHVCAFATNEGVGDVGHISNKVTIGKQSVSQRIWADWFLLSEASICVYTRSGFPRMACEASHHHAASESRLLEKGSCGKEGLKSWREAKTDVESLDSGCDENSKALAERHCKLLDKELGSWT